MIADLGESFIGETRQKHCLESKNLRTAKETQHGIWGEDNNFYVRMKIQCVRVQPSEGMKLVSHPF